MKVVRKNSLLVNIFHGIMLSNDDFNAKLVDFMELLDEHMIEFHELKIKENEVEKLEERIIVLEKQNKKLRELSKYWRERVIALNKIKKLEQKPEQLQQVTSPKRKPFDLFT